MRNTFIKTLAEIAAQDERIMLVTGDIGYMAIEPFTDAFPDRFVNAGVSEQNIVGLATGLAEAGFMPFVYSITPFITLRPYELIRNGPILHQLPVRVVGVGGGFEYGSNGPSHHGLEDVAVFRHYPSMTIVAPADAAHARAALQNTWNLPGPVYYRLGKDDKAVVEGLEGRFESDKAQVVREGSDLIMLTMGSIATEAVAAAASLAGEGMNCTVAVVPVINPAPTEHLISLLSAHPSVMTIEAHYISNGLGSLVAEIIAENGLHCRLRRCGVNQASDGRVGSQKYFHHRHGISADALTETAKSMIRETRLSIAG